MAEEEQKLRKAVAFSEGDTVIETNGKMRVDEEKNDSHLESEQPQSLSTAISSEPVAESNDVAEKSKDDVQGSNSNDDVSNMLKSMKKKKKNSKAS